MLYKHVNINCDESSPTTLLVAYATMSNHLRPPPKMQFDVSTALFMAIPNVPRRNHKNQTRGRSSCRDLKVLLHSYLLFTYWFRTCSLNLGRGLTCMWAAAHVYDCCISDPKQGWRGFWSFSSWLNFVLLCDIRLLVVATAMTLLRQFWFRDNDQISYFI